MHYLKEYKKESDGYEQQQEPWKHVSDGDEGRGNRTDGRHKHTQRDRHVHVDDIQVLGEAVHDPSQRSRVEVGHGRVQHALDEVVVEGTSGEVTSGGETKRGDHGEENCGGEDNSMTDDVMEISAVRGIHRWPLDPLHKGPAFERFGVSFWFSLTRWWRNSSVAVDLRRDVTVMVMDSGNITRTLSNCEA